MSKFHCCKLDEFSYYQDLDVVEQAIEVVQVVLDLRQGYFIEVGLLVAKVVVDQVASNLEEQWKIVDFSTEAELVVVIVVISIVGLAIGHMKDNNNLGLVHYNQQYYNHRMIVDLCKEYLLEMVEELLAFL